jgi:hypothetical protein
LAQRLAFYAASRVKVFQKELKLSQYFISVDNLFFAESGMLDKAVLN